MHLIAITKRDVYCAPCAATKRTLDKQGTDYTEVHAEDLDGTPGWAEKIADLGHRQAPVILIQDDNGHIVDHWSGFRPERIAQHAAQLPPGVTPPVTPPVSIGTNVPIITSR